MLKPMLCTVLNCTVSSGTALLVLPRRRQGLEKAKKEEYDAVIVDTAGRLQIDERLMEELREVGG
jgi:signal recognition particle subunit SRP54